MTSTIAGERAGNAGTCDRSGMLELVAELSAALAAERVVYCHWKSNEALDRSLSGLNDLDLLVARADRQGFLRVLHQLGFKAVALPPAREVPGVSHYYGLDERSGRLVHVHAHFRLVLGDDTTKNFALPHETAYLASRTSDAPLPVPAPEHELALLALRMILKHSTWDALAQRRGRLTQSEQRELAWLQQRADWSQVDDVVRSHLPFLADVWPACRRALEPGCPSAERARTAARLVRALDTCARRPHTHDTALRVVRRVAWGTRRRVTRQGVRKRLVGAGAVIAVVGGDGSGKSTAVSGLARWLSGPLEVAQVHLGRPPKSLTTMVVKAGLAAGHRAGLFPDLAEPTAPRDGASPRPSAGWLAWHCCTARDRRRAYVRARRVAAAGGVAVCDRFPLPQLRSMDGPRTQVFRGAPGQGRLAAGLVAYEARQYAPFARPDLLAVLRVDPEVAVVRKRDEEAGYVRRRSTEVWDASWEEDVVVLDAARPAADVLADLRAVVWERL